MRTFDTYFDHLLSVWFEEVYDRRVFALFTVRQRCGQNATCRALTRLTEDCESTIAELTLQKTSNITLIARHLVNNNHLQSVSSRYTVD